MCSSGAVLCGDLMPQLQLDGNDLYTRLIEVQLQRELTLDLQSGVSKWLDTVGKELKSLNLVVFRSETTARSTEGTEVEGGNRHHDMLSSIEDPSKESFAVNPDRIITVHSEPSLMEPSLMNGDK